MKIISLTIASLVCVHASVVFADERHAVIIGNNFGDAQDTPLKYAESDADRVAATLHDIGGVSAENLILLRGSTASEVRQAIVRANERIRARDPQNTSLIIYYSGHADETALHLGNTRLSLDELRGLVGGSAATFRLSIVDACRSGGLTRVKGADLVPRSQVQVQEDAVGEGTVFLSATSASEDAQESDDIRGSFFTHYLLSGLRGAADDDRDGAVDLHEAYRFAYDNTVKASSRTLAGLQHPTFSENLKGKGDVILTRWSSGTDRALFQFPQGTFWLLMKHSKNGPIIAEIAADHVNRTIGVPPDTYYIVGRGHQTLQEAKVTVRPRQKIDVRRVEFQRTDYARLVRKGSDTTSVSHGLFAGYHFRTGLYTDSTLCHGFHLGYSVDLPAVTITGRGGFCGGDFAFQNLSSPSREVDLEARVSRPIDIRKFTIDVGVGLAATLLFQEVRADFRPLQRADTRTTLGMHTDLGLEVQYALPKGLYLGVGASAMLYVFKVEQLNRSSNLDAKFATRFSTRFGKRF